MFSDALDREAAWLTAADTLPALPASLGGPFQIVQARWPRTPALREYGLYVLRSPHQSAESQRNAAIRRELITSFEVRMIWPFTSGVGSAEADQLAFERAIDSVIGRILGYELDKTHGGRFAWVAEEGPLTVAYDDPEVGIARGHLAAHIDYRAADLELNI